MEVWRMANGLEGFVEVSNLGNARYLPVERKFIRSGCEVTQKRKGGIYSQDIGKNGYKYIAFTFGGKRKKYTVHRLVGFAFVGGYFEGATINHINGNKLDNRADNLEWVSLSRNTQHQWEIGLANLRADNSPSRKLNSKSVIIIRKLLRLGANSNELSYLCGVSPACIYKIRDGKNWSSVLDNLSSLPDIPCVATESEGRP